MSSEPRTQGHLPLSDVRAAAEDRARELPSVLVVIGGSFFALFAILVFVVLGYGFDQAPHRIIKVLLGVSLIAGFVLKPRFGLWMFAIATPFLAWMPLIGVPGLNPLNVLLLSIAVPFALNRIIRGETVFVGGSMGPVIGVMIVLIALSVLRGAAYPVTAVYDATSAGLEAFRSCVTFAGYFVTLAMVKGAGDRRLYTYSVIWALLLEAIVTINLGRDGSGARALGSLRQANELGAYLSMYTVVAAALIPAVRKQWAVLLMIAATITGTIGVFMSVSRASLLALGIGLLFVALRSSKWMALLTALVMLTSPLWIPDYMLERLNETEVQVEGTDVTELDGAAQARVDTWQALTEIIERHPLDGVGFVGLSYVLPEMGERMNIEVKDSSHNTFLRFLAEMGILGLLIFLVLLFRCFQIAFRAMQRARNPFDRQLAVGFGAATMALVISCIFGDRFFPITVVGNYWILCALVDTLLREPLEDPA